MVIEAIAKKVLEMGATPIIGDSPAFGAISKIARRAGLDRFAEEYGIEIIELDSPRRVNTQCGTKPFTLTVSGRALDVDAIINIPKTQGSWTTVIYRWGEEYVWVRQRQEEGMATFSIKR